MKKAELELHFQNYHSRLATAQTAEEEGLYRAALDAAIGAWEHVDGMVQFERKYKDNSAVRIEAINLVLRYSPLLLDLRSLDKLEALLDEYRRIEKNAHTDLSGELEEARANTWANHRLWSYIDSSPNSRQDELRTVLGGVQDYWRSVIESWEKMGLVERRRHGPSYLVSLSTRLNAVVSGKCPACGTLSEAPKAMFLEETRCLQCKGLVMFVMVSILSHL